MDKKPEALEKRARSKRVLENGRLLDKAVVVGCGLLLVGAQLSAQQSRAPRERNSAAPPSGSAAEAAPRTPGLPGGASARPSTLDEPRGPESHDLLGIYELATRNDPTIRQAEAIYRAALELRPQARAQLKPTFQLGASVGGSDTENPNPPTNFVTGGAVNEFTGRDTTTDESQLAVDVTQSLFDRGKIVAVKQADKRVAQAEAQLEAARQDLMLRVAAAYFDQLNAQDSLAADLAAREALARQLIQQQRRFEVGLVAIQEVQESQAGYDAAVANVIAAEQTLSISEEQLREIVGERVPDLVGPAGALPLEAPSPDDQEFWVDAALKQNPQLIAARMASDAAQDDIAIARSARLPTLSLTTGYRDLSVTSRNNLHGPDPLSNRALIGSEGYNWSLDLRIPLFTGGALSSQLRQRVEEHRATLESAELVARQTERQARDAYLGVISSIASVRAYEQAQRSAETSLTATRAGFNAGTRTSIDVITGQNQLREAQTNYARARYTYIVSVLSLEAASGTLAMDDLQKINAWLK
ncbi:MAG TPA: TolC family outer membrane protein [Gammaproteobacteria bacterium]|nr:TolC family outer membrane protein [Gammaproteobacteria bacterium]